MKTDSPHQGRQFYTCSKSKDEQCGYFVSVTVRHVAMLIARNGPMRLQALLLLDPSPRRV